MASVYVSGDDTKSLVQYKENIRLNDHTYYGMGCSNEWGPSDGSGGSDIPCETRIIETADGEFQKNGTIYNFQASTNGTGGAILDDNSNSSDTFCPLGWQLPYSGTDGDYYDKSKSWKYLMDGYNLGDNIGDGVTSTTYPLSYIKSGYYYWPTGRLYYQTRDGDYWSSSNYIISAAYSLSVTSIVRPSLAMNKVYGVPLRCDEIIFFLHRRHGGRNKYLFPR